MPSETIILSSESKLKVSFLSCLLKQTQVSNMQDSERGLEHKLNVFLLLQCYYWLAIPTTNIKGSWRQFMRPLEDRKGSQAITVAPTCEADFVCVDGEDGELRRCEGEGPLKCG